MVIQNNNKNDNKQHTRYTEKRPRPAGDEVHTKEYRPDNLSNLKHRERMVGYNSRNKDVTGFIYLCRICSLILREPVQLSCGHRQCKSCVESKIERNIMKCPECQEETSKNDVLLDRGFKNDMKTLPIECTQCDWSGKLQEYESHLVNEHPNPSCEYCQRKFGSTNKLDLHLVNDCNEISVPCALKIYGCSSSVRRVEMSQHYLSKEHQLAVIAFIRREVSKFITDQAEGVSPMDINDLPHTTTSIPGDANTKLKEADETVDVLTGGLQALVEDEQRLGSESLQLHNMLDVLTKDFAKLKLSIQEQNGYLDQLRPNQEILSQDVASIKQKIEDLQFVSYDGTYIWKITNFAERMADAQSERQTSIYSPPFYSSPTGYKMRARLYLHGDGNARRTHVSLFFVLMRSEYDAILKFPFNYKVTFCLYDQSGGQKNHIDSFRPDTKSNSFQRPRSEMNIASGIPKFCPLSLIEQEGNPFIRDDTMFIKIMVDFGDMTKPLLTYALGLNPGLPMDAQQRMIREERENRAQHSIYPGECWKPNQKLVFLCEECFRIHQYSNQRFCDHRPQQRWIILHAGVIIKSGRCSERSWQRKDDNEMLGMQSVDLEPSDDDEIYFTHQPRENDTNNF